MLTILVRLSTVLDLTTPQIIASLGTTAADLCALRIPGMPFFAQVIGDAAATLGYDGMIVWSAQDATSRNLVIFPQNAPPLTVPYYVVTARR